VLEIFGSVSDFFETFDADEGGDVAQLKTINLTESARASNLRSKDTKPRKRG
jgi:hypothetical protein